ncbi:MAG TPA: type II secretion system secretin GspD [Deltaproteobacteria bacterium]|jgi:general secretion pathway protein D|nr:type II secretion system secretin GspD [Deltaproteobacteria bacterium]OQC28360.1 MAG: Type II secretion system protein D precursor [Deltaproteobacteria bacterium ADurb.Bin072]HRW79250.1 type II secretion system secretin GspD [Desulfomonilia bacterium]HNQ85130.1 type II secretion system secretin GspD [Deltaproteobacteria bacterium]HNS89430.1 type II secretion system secretin GspD [Deltaproteobacteria bacterium]
MDIRRVMGGAVLIVLLCVSGTWGARLIQDEAPLPVKKQGTQTTPARQQATTPQQPGTTQKEKVIPLREFRKQQEQMQYFGNNPNVRTPTNSGPGEPSGDDVNAGQQGASSPSPAPSVKSGNQTATQSPPKMEVDESGQFITMDFDGVDIKVFIKFIADITGKNFIIDEKVSGKITVISPRKMTMDEAYRVFLSVLEVNGFGTVDMGGVTKIVKAADAITKSLETTTEAPMIRDDTMITQIIQLRYSDANDMRNLLSPLMSKASSQLLSYPQSNVLIVTDSKSNIKKIMDILKVIDVAGFAQEVKIIPLTYASATDLAAKLGEIMTEERQEQLQRLRNVRQPESVGTKTVTKIIPYERTNAIIVMAPPQDLAGIEGLIKKLDIPTPSGKEDIHVYYLQYANAEDLAKVLTEIPTPESPDAQAQAAAAPAAGQTAAAQTRARTVVNPALKEQNIKISPDKETNSLIIYADPYQYKNIIDTIKFLDIPRKQVYVRAAIMEVNTTKDFKVGVEWTFAEDFKYDSGERIGAVIGRTGQNFIASPSDLPSGPLVGVIGEAITVTSGSTKLTFPNMSSFINAMAQDSDVNIISTPQILTMDNKEAEIKVGANIPYVTREDTDSTNIDRTVRTYDYRDVGVTLKLTPQINQQGNIRMDLFQEITTLVPGSTGDEYAPSTLKRSASTTVNIKDGSTMVIGGLIGDTLTLSDYRVPLLGDIPLIGWLFKSYGRSREKTNLYIFLTPMIIDTEEKTQALFKEKSGEADKMLRNMTTPGKAQPE